MTGGGDERTLTDLGPSNLDDWELTGAERLLRRLANRHGHDRIHTAAGLAEVCPDPAAHAADVEQMRRVLEAAGFVPYEPGCARSAIGRRSRSKERPC